MSVITTYDEKRNKLKDTLTDCLNMVKELLNEDIWGYEEMRNNYAIDVYIAVKKARGEI